MPSRIDESQCLKCGLCIKGCPHEAILGSNPGKISTSVVYERVWIDPGLCQDCGTCLSMDYWCPAEAIYVEAAENTDAERYSPGERYAKTYEINMLRCIFCGYCEDACPTDAIVLTDVYELAAGNRRDLIYTKDMLILPPPSGKPDTPQKMKEGSYPRAILPDGLVSEP